MQNQNLDVQKLHVIMNGGHRYIIFVVTIVNVLYVLII